MSTTREGAAIAGVGVAACAVCCAGPILGILVAIALTSATGFALFGGAGLVIAAAVALALLLRRQRRRRICATQPLSETVRIEGPAMRPAP